MSYLFVKITLLLAALCLASSDRIFKRNVRRDDIPPRCINNTVTPVSCEGVTNADRLLPHPDDCQLFYYCVADHLPPVCRQCPADLHFNPNKHVCDNPDDSGCKAVQATILLL